MINIIIYLDNGDLDGKQMASSASIVLARSVTIITVTVLFVSVDVLLGIIQLYAETNYHCYMKDVKSVHTFKFMMQKAENIDILLMTNTTCMNVFRQNKHRQIS